MSKHTTIDGVEYAPVTTPSEVVMVRSADAGVFYGNLVKREGDEVTLTNARRVYYWNGAATLSELATKGTSRPKDCKFPAPTAGEHLILGVCEVIPITTEALASLNMVPEWSMA